MRNLAATYRPTRIEDVVGQEQAKKILVTHINSKPKSSYLLCGGAGTGKTTCARIFAYQLNNSKQNVYEINAADNTGIEGVRKIIVDANRKPIGTPYKIFILDECHMLSNQAWNALLKLVEEPPDTVVLLFCTTDPQKIPNTIISRVLRVDFSRINVEQVTDRLLWILEQENITGVKREPLRYIAQLANGGMRDAISMMDKVIGYGVDITYDLINTALGLVGTDTSCKLLHAFYEHDVNIVLMVLEKLNSGSIDFKAWVQDFRRFVLQAVQIQLNVDESLIVLPPDTIKELQQFPKDGRMFHILMSLNDLVNSIIMEPDPFTLVKITFLKIVGEF